ncbi:MAG: DNA polymerase III sliding clamp [Candidatus Micrarchaeota archaeon]|nr:MAG: DNA polymerase III sliding clamp [Candidatus Micrarchaeota archaeon]
MLEVKLSSAEYWSACVQSIVNIVDEGSFIFGKDGVSLRAMDRSATSMVSFFMPKSSFITYNVADEHLNAKIGLNLDNLSKILKRARKEEQLIIKNEENKLALEFINNKSRRKYALPLIEAATDANKEPSFEFTAVIEIDPYAFREMLKDAETISEIITLDINKESLSLLSKGDSGDLEEVHTADTEYIKSLNVKERARSTFKLEMLSSMVSSAPKDSILKLSLSKDSPIRIDYNIGEAQISYYLANYGEEY